ncbi:MAG: hypothetical protein F6K19_45080, partial [Cyanothece sp. SIO1E1]|nr:hypothetical protein [Cyanothece sp. SIO1E1]
MTHQNNDSPLADAPQSNERTEAEKSGSIAALRTHPIVGVWHTASKRLKQFLPVEKLAQTAVGWFSVSEAQVAEILTTVRAEL